MIDSKPCPSLAAAVTQEAAAAATEGTAPSRAGQAVLSSLFDEPAPAPNTEPEHAPTDIIHNPNPSAVEPSTKAPESPIPSTKPKKKKELPMPVTEDAPARKKPGPKPGFKRKAKKAKRVVKRGAKRAVRAIRAPKGGVLVLVARSASTFKVLEDASMGAIAKALRAGKRVLTVTAYTEL